MSFQKRDSSEPARYLTLYKYSTLEPDASRGPVLCLKAALLDDDAVGCAAVRGEHIEAVASTPLDDSTIRTAVAAWFSDATAAEAAYGHISTWETGGVTDMSYLFCGSSSDYSGAGYCNTAAASFNEDIGAWDTSGVTTMRWMFGGASAFDQTLGWCVDLSPPDMAFMFLGTQCERRSCGVKEGGCATGDLASDGAATRSAALAALVLGAALA